MIKYLIAVPAILFLMIVYGCKKDPSTMPPLKDSSDNKACVFPAGNRSFSWQMDTVALFPSSLGGIWAFSDSDAYLMGNIFQWTAGVFTGYIGLHWNGKVWERDIHGLPLEIAHYANAVTGDDYFMVSVGYCSIEPPLPALGEFDNRTKKWKGYQFKTPGELYSVWTDGKGFFIACGTDGMVYKKDGYTSGWVYTKAPTDFNFTKVQGISKNEIYFLGVKSYITGEFPSQLWKYDGSTWIKLLDNHDTTGTPVIIPEVKSDFRSMAVYRCSVSDSLYIYLTGPKSFELKTKGNELSFTKTDLSSKGLPYSSIRMSAGKISLFSPNDYWIGGVKYYIYHWNGSDFKKIEPISTLPYGQYDGVFSNFTKTSSGKIWMILELSSQVYSVVQGTPNK